MKSLSKVILAIFCLLLVSCVKYGSRENGRLIRQVQFLAEQMPDSALILLDAVDTFKLKKTEKADYVLLRVQARSNAGMDISTDVDIFDTRKYHILENNPEKAALSCFYSGLVSTYRNNATDAMGYYHVRHSGLGKILHQQ